MAYNANLTNPNVTAAEGEGIIFYGEYANAPIPSWGFVLVGVLATGVIGPTILSVCLAGLKGKFAGTPIPESSKVQPRVMSVQSQAQTTVVGEYEEDYQDEYKKGYGEGSSSQMGRSF